MKDPIQMLADAKALLGNGEDKYPIDDSAYPDNLNDFLYPKYPDNLNDLLPPKPMSKYGPPTTFQQMDELDPGIESEPKLGGTSKQTQWPWNQMNDKRLEGIQNFKDVMPKVELPVYRDPEQIYSDTPEWYKSKLYGGVYEKTLPFRVPPKEGLSKWWKELKEAIDAHINRRNSSGAPGPGEYDVEKERHNM